MQNQRNTTNADRSGLARHMPLSKDWISAPEGALIPDERSQEDKIAVVYNNGDTPPKITISVTGGHIQTVCANGIAVAVVACADGPMLSVDDILLVERFVGRS